MRMSRYNNKSISAEGGKKKYDRGKPSTPSGGVWAKKALGQHFLKDESVAMDIVDAYLSPIQKRMRLPMRRESRTRNRLMLWKLGPVPEY